MNQNRIESRPQSRIKTNNNVLMREMQLCRWKESSTQNTRLIIFLSLSALFTELDYAVSTIRCAVPKPMSWNAKLDRYVISKLFYLFSWFWRRPILKIAPKTRHLDANRDTRENIFLFLSILFCEFQFVKIEFYFCSFYQFFEFIDASTFVLWDYYRTNVNRRSFAKSRMAWTDWVHARIYWLRRQKFIWVKVTG